MRVSSIEADTGETHTETNDNGIIFPLGPKKIASSLAKYTTAVEKLRVRHPRQGHLRQTWTMVYDFLRQKSHRSKNRATSQNIKNMDTSEHLQRHSFLVTRYTFSPRTAYNDRHYESTHVLERNEQIYHKIRTNVSRLPETQVT